MSVLRQRRAWTAAYALWLCVVWGHSLMSGDTSSAESSFVVMLVRPLLEAIGITDASAMSFAIRKAAHFSEYAILAALGWKMVGAWVAEPVRAGALWCALWVGAPAIDEAIQRMVPGRDGNPRDVLIDMAGGLVGALIARAWDRRKRAA